MNLLSVQCKIRLGTIILDMGAHMTSNQQIESAISLTESAAGRISQFLSKEGGRGIHLDVRKTGCSGWAYQLEISHDPAKPSEVVLYDRSIEIIITPQALSMMAGTTIDFVQEGLTQEFRFKNPNVTAECGCGESFTVNPPSKAP
jgi:iron-sulfur cluster assembly protein